MIDVHFRFTVEVPQLEALTQALLTIGAQIVAELQGIVNAVVSLEAQQAAGSDAIAAQLTVVADEISQLNASTIQQTDLDAIEARIRAAAQVATDQAAQIRASSQQIAGMVPDAPPPA